jgi:hypothetical protein
MDIPSSDVSEDACSDELAFGPLTESEYEELTSNLAGGPGEKGDGWRSCAICLEEMDTDLRRHASCSCVLCESCIDVSMLKLQLMLLSYIGLPRQVETSSCVLLSAYNGLGP